jgi:hypothetical protein
VKTKPVIWWRTAHSAADPVALYLGSNGPKVSTERALEKKNDGVVEKQVTVKFRRYP